MSAFYVTASLCHKAQFIIIFKVYYENPFLLFFYFWVHRRVKRVGDSVGTHMKVAQVLVVIDWINLASGTE